ncbi:hypothetical protein CA54_14800 [Symmachiella macrocystis]|uniref:Protein SirB1 N-terminal domain-containing protein n=1 Tax=Symmachiella macrocystis TaxID=2527985 RepID=A0A5C6BMX9_9PLAN|nr:hypothetical protein [Symmachiella macrocystis]TWU12656.1 hypothetical protein CA54_14800 [Symmachiella macrocystis]
MLIASTATRPCTLAEMLAISPAELGGIDIARANLLCSAELPGTTPVDVEALTQLLDRVALQVAVHTEEGWPFFEEHADELEHSQPLWRMLCLARFLQHSLRIKYCVEERDLRTVADWTKTCRHFLFGLLGPERHGTCSSLPVLLVAVGRRLGYPLRLVHSPGHVFCRWDAHDHRIPPWRECRNIEFNGDFDSHDDEHYYDSPLRWLPVWHAQERQRAVPLFLRSLTPAEEVASFLVQRAQVFEAHRMFEPAWAAYAAACRLAPHNDIYAFFAKECNRQHLDAVLKEWGLTGQQFCRTIELRLRGRRVRFPWEPRRNRRAERFQTAAGTPYADAKSAAILKLAEQAIRMRVLGSRSRSP